MRLLEGLFFGDQAGDDLGMLRGEIVFFAQIRFQIEQQGWIVLRARPSPPRDRVSRREGGDMNLVPSRSKGTGVIGPGVTRTFVAVEQRGSQVQREITRHVGRLVASAQLGKRCVKVQIGSHSSDGVNRTIRYPNLFGTFTQLCTVLYLVRYAWR